MVGVVPGEGVEPSLPRGNWILNPARLPIPSSGQRGIIENDEESYAWQVLSWVRLHTFPPSQKE